MNTLRFTLTGSLDERPMCQNITKALETTTALNKGTSLTKTSEETLQFMHIRRKL